MRIEGSPACATGRIVTRRTRPYLAGSMLRLLCSLLVVMAMFFSPLMMTSGAGMAMPHAAAAVTAADHCAGKDVPAEDDKAPVTANCASACAAFPAVAAVPSEHPLVPAEAAEDPGPQLLAGVQPEGETPPPRVPSEI